MAFIIRKKIYVQFTLPIIKHFKTAAESPNPTQPLSYSAIPFKIVPNYYFLFLLTRSTIPHLQK